MLDALVPHAHVSAFISPLHNTVTVAFIFFIVAFITVARFPLEHAMPVLLVILVHAIVGVALRVAELIGLLLLPLAMAMLETVPELTSVAAAILPLILAEAIWLAIRVLANITITIGEEVRAVTVTQTL